jgi:hypothetical protein
MKMIQQNTLKPLTCAQLRDAMREGLPVVQLTHYTGKWSNGYQVVRQYHFESQQQAEEFKAKNNLESTNLYGWNGRYWTTDSRESARKANATAAAQAMRAVNSPAQQAAAKANGVKGGRPKGTSRPTVRTMRKLADKYGITWHVQGSGWVINGIQQHYTFDTSTGGERYCLASYLVNWGAFQLTPEDYDAARFAAACGHK